MCKENEGQSNFARLSDTTESISGDRGTEQVPWSSHELPKEPEEETELVTLLQGSWRL